MNTNSNTTSATLLLDLAQKAEATRQVLRAHPTPGGLPDHFDFEVVRTMVDDADIAFGVWYDFNVSPGVHYTIVKSAPLLRRIASCTSSETTTFAAIPCTCAEQAEALRRVIAEPQQLN